MVSEHSHFTQGPYPGGPEFTENTNVCPLGASLSMKDSYPQTSNDCMDTVNPYFVTGRGSEPVAHHWLQLFIFAGSPSGKVKNPWLHKKIFAMPLCFTLKMTLLHLSSSAPPLGAGLPFQWSCIEHISRCIAVVTAECIAAMNKEPSEWSWLSELYIEY